MNGARGKNDGHPLHLCPVDLHKFCAFQQRTLCNPSFDIEVRYRRLFEFYSKHDGLNRVAEWVGKLLRSCFGETSPDILCMGTSALTQPQVLCCVHALLNAVEEVQEHLLSILTHSCLFSIFFPKGDARDKKSKCV